MAVYNPTISTQSAAAVTAKAVGMSYEALLQYFSQYNFDLQAMYMQAQSVNQVLQPMTWKNSDANGARYYSVTPPAVDPYQKQPTINVDLRAERIMLNGGSNLFYPILPAESLIMTAYARRNFIADYLSFKNKSILGGNPRVNIGRPRKKWDFTIYLGNNTNAPIDLNLFNNTSIRGFFNSPIRFAWDVTNETYQGDDLTVSVEVKLNGVADFQTYTAPVLTRSAEGVRNALNLLGVGTFYVLEVGSTILICTNNSDYTYGDLTLNSVSSAGEEWVSRISASDILWNAVAYGNGLFVAVSSTGGTSCIMTSPDGITWTLRSAPANNGWIALTFGNGLFVATGNSGAGNRVMTSPDGINWTLRTSANNFNWAAVTYGNGLYVAVGFGVANQGIMTSPDGITWTTQVCPQDNDWQGIVYANGLFVAVADTGVNRVMTSPDGITWTLRNAAAANSWVGITYGNGRYVAVAFDGGTNQVMTSEDGITWTIRTSAASNQWFDITFGNGLFVAVSLTGSGNRVMTSPDGITWTIRASAADNNWSAVAYQNNIFVAVAITGVGNRVMTSGEIQ